MSKDIAELSINGATLIIACIALAFSLITFIRESVNQKRLKQLEALQSNGSLLIEAWRQLATNPRLLRFHSISEEELKQHGLTHEDLAYLVVLFETADYYYQHISRRPGPFSEGSLRYAILKSPETRKAWQFMKPFFIASENYVRKIEATISYFDGQDLITESKR